MRGYEERQTIKRPQTEQGALCPKEREQRNGLCKTTMNNDRKELRTASSLYKRQSDRRGNGRKKESKTTKKEVKKGKQNSKQNGKQKSMEILKKGDEKGKQNSKQIGKQKARKNLKSVGRTQAG